MRRPPSRTQGILPVMRHEKRVRRETGSRASSCFSLMKPDGVCFCPAQVPALRISGLAGGLTLKKSFCSPFIHRKLYAKQRPGVRARHTGFSSAGDNIAEMESVLLICPIASAKRANRFTPDPRWTGIRTVATYRFWTRQALLLVKTRFLRPRNSRGETAICPAKWPRRCPQPRAVRVRSGAVSSPQPGVSASSP